MPVNLAKKNRDIEVLRCIAIVFTIFQHISLSIPNNQWWNETIGNHLNLWTGVDLFFVISGFVITRTLLPLYSDSDKYPDKKKVLYEFWLKRIFRLLPTAWLWLLLPLLFSAWTQSLPLSQVFYGALAGILQLSNLYFAHCTDTHTLFTECNSIFVSGHYWSLSLEEQFYIVLPLLLLLVPSKRFIFLGIFTLVLIFFWNRPIYSYGWYFRVDGFLWGVLLSLFAHNYSKMYSYMRPKLLDNALIRIPVCLFFVVLLGLAPNIPLLSSVATIAIICAVLVLMASYNRGYTFGSSMFSGAMVAIGARSYSLYVIHVPVFFFTSSTMGRITAASDNIALINILSFVVSIVLLVSLTELNYRYIEIPIRDKGRTIAKEIARSD
mgnify:FL=1